MYVYISYSEMTTGGGIRAGEENEEWPPSQNPTYIDFVLKQVYIGEEEKINKSKTVGWEKHREKVFFHAKEGSEVHIVVVRYKDGDTFGTSHGNFYIEGVYATYDEAYNVSEAIYNKTYKGGEYNYVPWEGYFSSLEDVEIHTRTVRKI